MNTVLDTVLEVEDKVEAPRQEQTIQPAPALIELGKVSDTRGAWWGAKIDAGIGVIFY